MPGRLQDKVAIITGAGRGLGKAFALRFCDEGAKLLLPDISLERAEATAKEIKAKGGQAYAMLADISSEKDDAKIASEAQRLYGGADILLNNAAIYYGVQHKSWDAWSLEDWDRMFAVNVRGTWQVSKAVAPLMVKKGKGKIINIASDVFKVTGGWNFMPYACSKSAVYVLTQCLARALGPSGINVNSIAPGYTATEASLGQASHDKTEQMTIEGQAIKRREEPSDLPGTAVFLASSDSDFITGQYIVVNGGNVMV
ncbi:MAG TPA: SDR family oxidoreductase [Dehalococcoidales bacterium]|nr:SDR family oxidoreductase [Dehalococcoidales bacterium]